MSIDVESLVHYVAWSREDNAYVCRDAIVTEVGEHGTPTVLVVLSPNNTRLAYIVRWLRHARFQKVWTRQTAGTWHEPSEHNPKPEPELDMPEYSAMGDGSPGAQYSKIAGLITATPENYMLVNTHTNVIWRIKNNRWEASR